MNEHLKSILEDLYRLDPTLKGEEEAISGIVTTLLREKPEVVPDASFVARLRAEIVSTSVHPTRAVPSPWYFYAAPAGVFALLLLMLVPQFVTSPTVPAVVPQAPDSTRVVPESVPQPAYMIAPTEEEFVDIPMNDGVQMKSMGGAPETSSRAAEDLSLMALPVGDEPMNSVYVSSLQPGMSVHVEAVFTVAPALLVVYSGTEVLGVSEPILPGILTESTVVLSRMTHSGEELVIVLYEDRDGDGIFTPGVDHMLTDPMGNPIQQIVVVSDRPF